MPRFLCSFLFFGGAAAAQLIPNGSPIPRTPLPPVVFLDGYQASCSGGTSFSGTFGKFDQLQAANRVSLFFDNCSYAANGRPTIEELGNFLGGYLAALRYADGGAVAAVDVVAHSMGGLIVRSYLAGKQDTEGMFQPPAEVWIRKAVFLATPHFGSPLAALGGGSDVQTKELANGSLFVFDLAVWNQGADDLRGVDALALAGNGGTGLTVMANFDDGVVSLSSASIGFAAAGRTRVIPYCHTGPGLITLAGLCPPNTPGIAEGNVASDANAAAVLSFLSGTTDWQTIGQAPEQNAPLSSGGGLVARAMSAGGQFTTVQAAKASKDLNVSEGAVAWTELLPAGAQDLTLSTLIGPLEAKFNQPAGYTAAVTVKPGSFIIRVFPTAAIPRSLVVAPGMFVAIYGTGFGSMPVQAPSLPYPTTLGGAQVLLNGAPVPLQFVGPTQINAVVPETALGLVTIQYSAGSSLSQTVNVLIVPAAPEIYSQDQTGSGPAAALNAVTNLLVSSTAPLHAGIMWRCS